MEGEGGELDWRQLVLEAVMVWAVRLGAILIAVVAVSMAWREPSRLWDIDGLVLFGSFGVFCLFCALPARSYRARALGFCGLAFLMGSAGLYTIGLTPGVVMTNAFAVVSAGLFLGQRAMFVCLCLTTGAVLMIGILPAPWHWPSPALAPKLGAFIWLRLLVGYAVLTGTMALLVARVVAKIEHALSATSQALRRLKAAEEERLLAEDALVQTEEALLRSQKLEAVGRLAAGVGHDFNNSLQVVLSWTSLLRGERDPALVQEGLDALEQAALQGSELTQRLLAFGRRDVRAPSPASPARLLEESAKSLRRLLPEDISIELDVAPELPTVLVDSAQLAHVLLNLGVNAKDAMPAGGVLTFGAACVEHSMLPDGLGAQKEAQRWVHLWVRDTGVGMSSETLAHLFEPFFTTKGERGTGLGLATSYAMVQQNGGLIHVRSEEGKGAELGIYLPEHGAPLERAAPSRAARRKRGAVVMVAEDDDNVRESLVRVLGAAGFRVVPSANAASAMELLSRVGGAVDVLCTDGIMPGGGTRQLIDKYRSQSPSGQVIICSGYVQEELLRRELDAGAFAYLPKPFLPSELVDRINTLLSAPAEQQGGERR